VLVVFIHRLAETVKKSDSTPAPAHAYHPDLILGLFLAWVLIDIAGAVTGGRNYPHYFQSTTASLAVMGGLAYWKLKELGGPTSDPRHRLVLASFILVPLLMWQVESGIRTHRDVKRSAAVPKDQKSLIQYLVKNKQPGDTMFSWFFLPAIYYDAKMRNAIRYQSADNYIRISDRATEEIGGEIMWALRANRPTYIIDMKHKKVKRSSTRKLHQEFRRFVKENYKPVCKRHTMNLYRLKAVPP
jgi:hypothetical protein